MTKVVMPPAFAEYTSVLLTFKVNGEQPTMTLLLERLGVIPGDFHNAYNDKAPWTFAIKKAFNQARNHWKKNGGTEVKELKKALKSLQKRGEEASVGAVCREANFPPSKVLHKRFEWQKNIHSIIQKAKIEYAWGIHNSTYDKCLATLEKMLKEGEFPTVYKVSVKATSSKETLRKSTNIVWKQKVIAAIEKTYEGYEKLNPLFINADILIEKVVSNTFIDYRHIGLSLRHHKTNKENYFHLAHIMYEEHLIGVSSGSRIADIYVKKESYNPKKKAYIDGIIMACEGVKQKTIKQHIPYIVHSALWLGRDIPKCENDGQESFISQAYRLERMIKSGEMTHQVAWYRQQGLLKLLSAMFDSDRTVFTTDYNHLLIPNQAPKPNGYSNVAKFTQKELSYAFAFYYHLFKQLAEILLENQPLPQPIVLPAGKALVLGLGNTLIATKKTKNGNKAIDYDTGDILSDKQIEALAEKEAKHGNTYRSNAKPHIDRAKKKALEDLGEINTDFSHPKRLQLGKKALDAWFMCMLFFTAMNDSTLGTYKWNDDDELELEPDERKEFINIKPRAKYKTVRFPLPKACLEDFKQFLKLRRFVLDGHSTPYLFFISGYGNDAKVTEDQFGGSMSANIKHTMTVQLDSDLPGVTSRSSRRDNARDALQDHGLEVALSVLQNKSNVLIRHYNGQTAEEMASDVFDFLDSMHDTVVGNKPIAKNQEHSMGGCEVEGEKDPVTFSEKSPIQANCDDPKSCIFCKHYTTFHDSENIRKLLSLKYIIENTAYDRAPSDDFYQNEMKPWLKRIDYILHQMIEKEPTSEQTIETITDEVNDGLLSPYWLLWSEIFEELGRFA